MNIPFTKRLIQFLVFGLLLNASAVSLASENSVAGLVVRVTGTVEASNGQNTRVLERRSELYAGDTIITGADSFAQIRMTDSAIVSLKQDSTFEITEFVFQDVSGQPDKAAMKLVRGGLRTITGAIGEANKEAYSVETPFATIGIRGTDHEIVISSGCLVAGVYDGGTGIGNNAGQLDIGVGADYDFAQVCSINSPPQGLSYQPAELGDIAIYDIADVEADAADTLAAAPSATTALTAPLDSLELEFASPQASVIAPQGVQEVGNLMLAQLGDRQVNPSDSGGGVLPCTGSVLVCVDGVPEPEPEPEPPPPPPPPPPTPALTSAEIASLGSRSGIAVGNSIGVLRGSANDFSSAASPLFANVTSGPVLRAGSALRTNFQTNIGGFEVQWGLWNSNGSNTATVQTNLNDGSVSAAEQHLLLISAIPSPGTALPGNNLTGTVKFATSDFQAVKLTGNNTVQQIMGSFNLNLGSGAISNGAIDICVGGNCTTAPERWAGNFSGLLIGGQLNQSVLAGNIVSATPNRSFSGSLTGLLTGADANGFVAGFSVNEVGNVNNKILGSTLFTRNIEVAAEYGMLTIGNADTGGVFGGRVLNRSGITNLQIADFSTTDQGWAANPLFHAPAPEKVFRRGEAPLEGYVSDVAGLGGLLSWGKWAGSISPVERFTIGSIPQKVEQDVYWFIATPSAAGQQTGTYSYSTVLAAQGAGSNGSISSTSIESFGFTLNLNTGSISNGLLKINNETLWTVYFTGTANAQGGGYGPFVTFNVESGNTQNSNRSSGLTGNMSGMFINSGRQLVSAFSFSNGSDDGNAEYIAGNVLVGRDVLSVGWGAWNNPVGSNWDGPMQAEAQQLFNTLTLTPVPVLNALEGEYQYSSASGVSGYGSGASAGKVSALNAGFTVDFNTGAIRDGNLGVTIDAAAQVWKVNFSGQLADGLVTLTPLAQSLRINEIVNTGSANLGGVFTGLGAQGFLGAFELIDGNNATNLVQGVYTLQRGL